MPVKRFDLWRWVGAALIELFYKIVRFCNPVNILREFILTPPTPWAVKVAKLISKGRYDEVAELCFERLEKHPDELFTLKILGQILRYRGRLDESLECFRRYLRKKPKRFFIHYEIGLVYFKKKMYERAVEEMLIALEKGFGDDEILVNLAKASYLLGKFEDSSDYFERYLKRHRRDGEVRSLLGEAYRRRKLYSKAIETFKKAIELGKDGEDEHLGLAEIYTSQRKWDCAILEYKRVLDFNPDNFIAHYFLGSIYNILGEESMAIDELLKAHRINPGDEETKEKLERLLISKV